MFKHKHTHTHTNIPLQLLYGRVGYLSALLFLAANTRLRLSEHADVIGKIIQLVSLRVRTQHTHTHTCMHACICMHGCAHSMCREAFPLVAKTHESPFHKQTSKRTPRSPENAHYSYIILRFRSSRMGKNLPQMDGP
jgi:hypothetical protein